MDSKKASTFYKKTSTETASPGKLILMLYDGAIRFMVKAIEGFELEDRSRGNEEINNNLSRAIEIITELRASLDLKVEGELPKVLNDLYLYFEERLTDANLKKNIDPVLEVLPLVQDIRNSWAEMLSQKPQQEEMVTSIACSA